MSADTGRKATRWALAGLCTLIGLWLILPLAVIVPISFSGEDSFAFPPQSWTLARYANLVTPQWTQALLNSLVVALLVAGLCAVLGTLAAFAIVRSHSRAMVALRLLILAPQVVPIIIVGLGVYLVFLGWQLTGTVSGFVIAHAALSLPFVVIPVAASLQTFDRSLERASASLGAAPVATFFQVTFPIIRPAILSGTLLAFLGLVRRAGARAVPAVADLRHASGPALPADDRHHRSHHRRGGDHPARLRHRLRHRRPGAGTPSRRRHEGRIAETSPRLGHQDVQRSCTTCRSPRARHRCRVRTMPSSPCAGLGCWRPIEREGLAGLIVWGRGSTNSDGCQDLLYLTNHMSAVSHIPDSHAHRARGHAALVLAPGREPVLVTDSYDIDRAEVAVDDIRLSTFVDCDTAKIASELGLRGRRIGLAGQSGLLHSAATCITDGLGPSTVLAPADHILGKIRLIKSAHEVELLRDASRIGCEWMEVMLQASQPGRTEGEIVGEGATLSRRFRRLGL